MPQPFSGRERRFPIPERLCSTGNGCGLFPDGSPRAGKRRPLRDWESCPCRENVGGLYTDYDQYFNGSIGPAGTFYYGYLRILGGEVLPERETVDGRECVVVRYPHLGSDQVYKFYLDPKLGYRPWRLEQYFDRTLYRRIDDYRYVPANGAWLPVSVRITDYAVKDPGKGRVIGVTVMRVLPDALRLNGRNVDMGNALPGTP